MLSLLLVALLFLPVLGFFLSGPPAWGFNHLSYLPRPWIAVSALLALVLAWPRAQRELAGLLERRVPLILFGGWPGRAALLLVLGAIFALLRERSYFMGDGYLIGELVDRGVPFRAFDNLDYLLHQQLHRALKASHPIDSFDLYRGGAVFAGLLGGAIVFALAKRLPWEGWRRALAVLFFLGTGPATLFFGYVESYSFLYVFLTAFLISGLLVFARRGSLWVASTFFGLALAFHLTALFSAPAMLYLALRAPVAPVSKRWREAVLPAAILFLVSIGAHLLAGYNEQWFRKEFIDAKNTKSIWLPFLEPQRGFLSLYHWKDLLNLALITAPACLAVVLSRARWIRLRWRRPEIGFLLVQMASLAFFALSLDRKLGGARDWDLLAAHAGGLMLLATAAFPRGEGGERSAPREAGLVWGATTLVLLPWVLLLHSEPQSIARFVSVASDFPNFARAYAYEEVGKYYRKRDDLPRAEEMYERCVESYPKNPRFLLLLGSIYFAENKLDDAERLYQGALDITPDHKVGLEMMAKLKAKRADSMSRGPARRDMYAQAADYTKKLLAVVPNKAEFWQLYGQSSLQADRYEEAKDAFEKSMSLRPSVDARQGIATSLMFQGRYAEAVPLFRDAARASDSLPIKMGLAMSLLGVVQAQIRAGLGPDLALLDEADSMLAVLRARNPNERTAAELTRRLEAMRHGVDPDRGTPASELRPDLGAPTTDDPGSVTTEP